MTAIIRIIIQRAWLHDIDMLTSWLGRTSWHRNNFPVTDSLWGEFTDHWWTPPSKGQWCGALFLWAYIIFNKIRVWLRRYDARVTRHCNGSWFVRWPLNHKSNVIQSNVPSLSAFNDGKWKPRLLSLSKEKPLGLCRTDDEKSAGLKATFDGIFTVIVFHAHHVNSREPNNQWKRSKGAVARVQYLRCVISGLYILNFVS